MILYTIVYTASRASSTCTHHPRKSSLPLAKIRAACYPKDMRTGRSRTALFVLCLVTPPLLAQDKTSEQIRTEFQKALGTKLEDLSDKGKQDLDALAKNMDPAARQSAAAKLAALEAQAKTPAEKAQIAKAYTALARQAEGKGAVDLALKARKLAPNDSEVQMLTESVLRMARGASQGKTSQAAAPAIQAQGQPIVNNIYVIMVNDSSKGSELARKFSKGQVVVQEDRTGRLKDTIVEATWEGAGTNRHLVVSLDSEALAQNKHAPATLAPLMAKALDNGDFIRENGDGMISRVEMAVRGWFSTGKVGDQIMTKGKNRIDTEGSTAGKIVGFFVDLFRGKLTQDDYGSGVDPDVVKSAKLNIMMKRNKVECFGATAEVLYGPKDAQSGAKSDANYHKNLTATKDRLRQEQ